MSFAFSKLTKYIVTFLCLGLWLCPCIYTQQIYEPEYGDPLSEPWRWMRFDELLGKGVRCISETADNKIVFGLNKGIITYDGQVWEEQNSKNGFIDDAVSLLVYSDDRQLFAGTNKGLYLFNGKKWNKIFPQGSCLNLEVLNIVSLIKLKGGGIVASFENMEYNGLVMYNNGRYEILASQQTINSLIVSKETTMYSVPGDKCHDNIFYAKSIFQDRKDRFWVWESRNNKNGNIFYFKKSKDHIAYSKLFTSNDGLLIGKETKFEEDSKGNIWVINSEFHKGLSVFNGQTWKTTLLEGENSFLSIKHVKDEIWIGSFGILYAYKKGQWKIYKRPRTPIPTSKIFVFADSRGYLWVSGIQGEVIRIDYSGCRWNSLKSLNYQCEDLDGNLWFISIDGRIVVKKTNRWYSYGYSDGLPDSPVNIICLKGGDICVSGSHKEQSCISFFNGSTWSRQLFPELSWGIDYRAVYEDNDNNLWISGSVNNYLNKGQKGGVLKIQNPGKENQITKHYLPENDLTMSSAYGFAQTKDGSMWLGGKHLAKLNNGKWVQYNGVELLNQHINTMGNTPEGTLWVGSRTYGVFQFKDNQWSVYNTDNFLMNNSIISILPIAENNVWVATNNDFSRFDGSCWATGLFHDDLTLSQEEGELESQRDGTLWINRSSRNWKRRAIHNNIIQKDDEEYFSTISYNTNKQAPDTKISVYSKEVSSEGNTYIEWKGLDAWNETPPSKLQYSYRLNNGKWSIFSNKTNTTFLNLKNGKYLFEVRARDIDFNIDLTPGKINFVVLPPVWKQLWFKILIITFLLVVIIYQFITYRQKKNLEKLNLELLQHGKDIAKKNIILEEQKALILQQTINEKEQNQIKLQFFTNISHEFRTPLSVVTGIIDNLSKETLKKDPDYHHEQLLIIKKNANLLLHLINQLMDFRKLNNSFIKLCVSEIDVVGHIKDICNSFKTLVNEQGIELHFNCELNKLKCWIDVDKLEKILFNLVSNAIKFTPKGGEISIIIKKTKLNDIAYMKVIVEDTGIGIPENKKEKIFDRFYQIDSNHLNKNKGSGIGLSIVNNYVKLHHGSIKVVSSVEPEVQKQRGYSTRFFVQLPIEKTFYGKNEIVEKYIGGASAIAESFIVEQSVEEKLNSEYQQELPLKRTTPHVLIVEDNTDLRRFMVDSLKKHFRTIEAKNGAEGYELTLSVLPDIIISDIMMPKMSGSELCAKIKNDLRTSHIPIILLTALTADENKIEGFQIGVDDYITKPFNFNILFARINNILKTRARLKQKFKNEEAITPDEEKIMSMDAAFLQKLKSILEKKYNNPQFNVEDLSKQIGISSRHLLHKLKSLVGMSPVEYIKVFRLQKAAQLLSAKKGSISEIAYDTGFNDLSYFGKCFSKHFGKSPSEYLKTYSKEQSLTSNQ